MELVPGLADPSTWEAEAGRSWSLSPDRATQRNSVLKRKKKGKEKEKKEKQTNKKKKNP